MKLNAGEGAIARYFAGSGTDTLLLKYLVQEGDMAAQLDFDSLAAENTEGGREPKDAFVRRKSTLSSTDADLSVLHVQQLSDNFSIEIDGSKPTLIGVSLHENDEGRSLARRDTMSIVLQFTASVEIDLLDPPLLGMLVGTRERWATYLSGSGSSRIMFMYTAVVGDDVSSPLDLKYTKICRVGNCSDLGGLIMRQSSASILDADLEQGEY